MFGGIVVKNISSNWKWGSLGFAGICGLGLIYQRFRGLLLAKFFLPKETATIGIIGGADGPTAIFVASKLSPNLSHFLLILGFIVGVVGFFILRKQNK